MLIVQHYQPPVVIHRASVSDDTILKVYTAMVNAVYVEHVAHATEHVSYRYYHLPYQAVRPSTIGVVTTSHANSLLLLEIFVIHRSNHIVHFFFILS